MGNITCIENRIQIKTERFLVNKAHLVFLIMKTKILYLAILTLCLTSCKKNEKKSIDVTQKIEETVDESTILKLNNGEKWIANPETHIGVSKMDSILNVFKSDTAKDYNTLGESLSKQTSFIIQKCNMKGESHDQLHQVLVPMLDEISIIKESQSQDDKNEALTNLEILIRSYFMHFKTQ